MFGWFFLFPKGYEVRTIKPAKKHLEDCAPLVKSLAEMFKQEFKKEYANQTQDTMRTAGFRLTKAADKNNTAFFTCFQGHYGSAEEHRSALVKLFDNLKDEVLGLLRISIFNLSKLTCQSVESKTSSNKSSFLFRSKPMKSNRTKLNIWQFEFSKLRSRVSPVKLFHQMICRL